MPPRPRLRGPCRLADDLERRQRLVEVPAGPLPRVRPRTDGPRASPARGGGRLEGRGLHRLYRLYSAPMDGHRSEMWLDRSDPSEAAANLAMPNPGLAVPVARRLRPRSLARTLSRVSTVQSESTAGQSHSTKAADRT